MTNREELLALALRVEGLSGPDRLTDMWIENHLGLARFEQAHPWRAHCEGETRLEPKPFTASLDSAMSLIPEGWRLYTADFSISGRARWMLEGPKTKWVLDEDGEKCAGSDWYAQGIAATPALALTAASLRARAEVLP
jgi:hypothetical protein